jgi:hypothetical protein
MEPGGEGQDEKKFHQLARLDFHAADRHPAFGAEPGMAELGHRDEQDQAQHISRPGKTSDNSDIHHRQNQHYQQHPEKTVELAVGIGRSRSAGGRIERRIADAGQGADAQDEQPVDPQEFPHQPE